MTPRRWQQIEEIFHQAVELASDQRISFLDRACEDDTELRREVESLLAGEEDTQTTLMSTVILAAAQSLSKDRPDEFVGRRIGSYRITGIIGQGGMAEVFRAVRDDDQYQKQVAIKLIQRGMVSNFTLSRFRYERQILASLEHPNIARLLDGGTTEDGMPYFVMEYIEGQPITEYCVSNKLSVRERLNLFSNVCEAVQHAHRNLIIHRDLKPSNILVTREGTPKLLDFGIAKLLDPESSTDAVTVARTMTTARLMTPDYASPEQVRGDSVTTATDIYSLGAVLYHLLTGQRPHRFKNFSLAEIEKVVCEIESEKPSLVVGKSQDAPARLRKELSGDVDNIVMMAMRKERERRYQSVEQLSEDIRRHLDGRTVRARQDTVLYRTGKFIRRHRLGVGFAAVLFILLVGFAVTMAVQATRIARERDRANQVTEFLVDLFEVSSPSEARGNQVTAREILDKGAEKIDREMQNQPEVQAALMDTMGRVYRSLGLYDSAMPLVEKSLALRQQTLGREHPEVANSLHTLARIKHAKGDYDGAESLYREALAQRRKLLGEDNPTIAESLTDLGELIRAKGDNDGAESMHRQAVALRRKLLGGEHPDLAISLNNLGLVLDEKGDFAGAEQMYREALNIKRKSLAEDHPSIATTMNNLAALLRNKGDYDEAESLYREALALRRKVLGQEHPEVAISLNNLAYLLRSKKDYKAAEPLYREALAIRRKRLGNEHPSVGISLVNLADLLHIMGSSEAAEPMLKEALDILRKTPGQNHWLFANGKSLYGACLTKLSRYPEAEEELLAAHAGLKSTMGAGHERTQTAVNRLIDLYEAWGQPTKAAEYRTLLKSQ